jgi:thiol-disulfide isomerase/thioredoxin
MTQMAERRSRRKRGSSTGTYIAIGVVGLVVVVAVVIAVLVSSSDPGASDFDHAAYSVDLSGAPLTRLGSSGADPSVGSQAPSFGGTDFDGNPVEVSPDGRPVLILFLAHWCPHCQNEVRWLSPWFEENGLPEGVRVVSVATSIDSTAPNYPPNDWLTDADWPVPVIVDDQQETVAAYFGLNAFPYWVVLNGDGTVRERFTGELEADAFEQLIDELS